MSDYHSERKFLVMMVDVFIPDLIKLSKRALTLLFSYGNKICQKIYG